jgi:hypothetical protein
MTTLAPSRIARTIAGQLWPDVQAQYRCVPGVYGFSCAGHGGLVAVLDAAKLPAYAVNAARECGKMELVASHPRGRGFKTYTTVRYTADSLRKLALDPRVTLHECWIGEEDCDWATIAYADPGVVAGGVRAGYFSQSAFDGGEGNKYVRDCLKRWNLDFFTRVNGQLEEAPA